MVSGRTTVSESVHRRLRRDILSGKLKPGTLLPPERELSAELGANRGAVREALKRLEQANLVRIVQGAGARIQDWRRSGGVDLLFDLATISGEPDLEVIRAILQMRVAQTADVARLAATTGSPERRERAAARAEQITTHPPAERPGAILDFWEALLDASGNIAYRLSYNTLLGGLAGFAHRLDVFVPELGAAEVHRELARCLRAGDGLGAEAAARALVGPTVDRLR